MTTILDESVDASAWVKHIKSAHASSGIFGQIVSGVAWTDEVGEDGELLVPADPLVLVNSFNANGYPILNGHDPGHPLGRLLAAEVFTSSSGTRFVAVVLGLYDPRSCLNFRDIGLDPSPPASSPSVLTDLISDIELTIASDPREVEAAWLDDVLRDAPLRIHRIELSHNAADPLLELIRIGVPYVVLVWNPLVTSVATEAGKDVYAGFRRLFRAFLERLAERRNPVLEIQSHEDGCQVSFLIRGKDVKRHYAAHDALPLAAAQAAMLVGNMKARGFAPKVLLYEFEPQGDKWFPSFAELHDGRFVGDRNILIAVEQLPSGLSLGLTRTDGKRRPLRINR